MSTEQSGLPGQRRFHRTAIVFPVTVILPGEELVMYGNAVDLSGGGMRVITKSDLNAGQNVTLRFTLPETSREMMVRGRVVLSFYEAANEQYAHGIAFTQIAADDQNTLIDYIHEVQRART